MLKSRGHFGSCFGGHVTFICLCRLDTQLEVTLPTFIVHFFTNFVSLVFHLLSFDCWKALLSFQKEELPVLVALLSHSLGDLSGSCPCGAGVHNTSTKGVETGDFQGL